MEVELAGQRGPEGFLVSISDVPLEVQAPRLRLASRVAERAKRDRELGRPADLGDLGTDLPGAVPVHVEPATGAALLLAATTGPKPTSAATAHPAAAGPFIGDLPVVFHTGRVGAEDEPVLLVQVGVDDDLEAVGVRQGRVAAAVGHDDRLRILNVADHPEIQHVVGVDDLDLGALRRRPALVGLVLTEAGSGHRIHVGRIVEDITVDEGRLLDPPGAGKREAGRRELALDGAARITTARLYYGLLSLRDALGHEARQSQGGEETSKRRVGVHRASGVQEQRKPPHSSSHSLNLDHQSLRPTVRRRLPP